MRMGYGVWSTTFVAAATVLCWPPYVSVRLVERRHRGVAMSLPIHQAPLAGAMGGVLVHGCLAALVLIVRPALAAMMNLQVATATA